MKRNLLISALLVGGFLIHGGPLCPKIQAESAWFLRAQGGFMGTTSQLQKGKVWGTAEFSFLRPVYGQTGNIAVGGSYQDVKNVNDESWENYTTKIYYFPVGVKKETVSRPGTGGGLIEQHKTQPYIFTGVGGTHESGGSFAEGSFNGGVGVMFPLMGANSMVEFGASRMKDQWFLSFTGGLLIKLGF